MWKILRRSRLLVVAGIVALALSSAPTARAQGDNICPGWTGVPTIEACTTAGPWPARRSRDQTVGQIDFWLYLMSGGGVRPVAAGGGASSAGPVVNPIAVPGGGLVPVTGLGPVVNPVAVPLGPAVNPLLPPGLGAGQAPVPGGAIPVPPLFGPRGY